MNLLTISHFLYPKLPVFYVVTGALLSIGFAVQVVLFVYLFSLREQRLARALMHMIGNVMIWNLGYLLEFVSVSLQLKLFWFAIQQFGVLMLPMTWLAMILIFCEKDEFVMGVRIFGDIFTLIVMITVFTTHQTGWYISDPQIINNGQLDILVYQEGIWFMIASLARLLMFLTSIAFMLIHLFTADKHAIKFVVIMLISTIFVVGLGVSNYLGVYLIEDVNNVLLFSSLISAILFFAIKKDHFFNLVPYANRLLVEKLADGIVIVDMHKQVVSHNIQAKQIFHDMTWKAISQKMFINLIEEVDDIALLDDFDYLEKHADQLSLMTDDKQHQRYYDFSITKAEDAHDVMGYILQFRDVSRHLESYHSIKQIAEKDGLTGVMNRYYFSIVFSELYEQTMSNKSSFSIAVMDLNEFKFINDNYGHLVGDKVLQIMAKVCQANIRKMDLLVRFGGDEFVMVLPNIDKDTMVSICDNIQDKFQKEVAHNIQGLDFASFSYGVCICDASIDVSVDATTLNECLSLEEILNCADKNMYKQKRMFESRLDK